MRVEPGTKEYQQSVRRAKEYLVRLKKGSNMLSEAVDEKDMVQAQKVIRHWEKLSNELFVELEMATIIHQSLMTGNDVMIKADGTVTRKENVVDGEAIEMEPWTLLAMEKLVTVFGHEIKDILEIKERQ